MHLKHACLPISPPEQAEKRWVVYHIPSFRARGIFSGFLPDAQKDLLPVSPIPLPLVDKILKRLGARERRFSRLVHIAIFQKRGDIIALQVFKRIETNL